MKKYNGDFPLTLFKNKIISHLEKWSDEMALKF